MITNTNKEYHLPTMKKITLKNTLLMLFLVLVCQPAFADHRNGEHEHLDGYFDQRRVRSGLKLFRSMLAADRDLTRKAAADGKLQILLVYNEGKAQALPFAAELSGLGRGASKGRIHNLPLKIKVINYQELGAYRDKRVAGIYLLQTLVLSELEKMVQYGINKHVVVYSPFEGDVEQGVLGGLFIDTQVHPFINLDTMNASKLRIKSFFLKMAKKYER